MTKRLWLCVLVACGGPAEQPKNAIDVPMQPTAPPPSADPTPPPAQPPLEEKPRVHVSEVTDPLAPFTMDQATSGLEGSGPLVATIKTSKGDLACRLLSDKAPV